MHELYPPILLQVPRVLGPSEMDCTTYIIHRIIPRIMRIAGSL